MEDAVKILSTKFNLPLDVLQNIGNKSEDISSWLVVLGAYILDNDKKQEDQKVNEISLRKQRLNTEHQLSQLEKQLISCNTKLAKYEKNILHIKIKLEKSEEDCSANEKKLEDSLEENKNLSAENEKLLQKYSHLENEKADFAELIERKNQEVDRLNEEWTDMSTKLAEANKKRYELQYKLDEIQNSDIRKEFKEKRLEQEKIMLLQQMEQITSDLHAKSNLVSELQKDKSSKLLDIKAKYDISQQDNLQLKTRLEVCKKTSEEQTSKSNDLMKKLKRSSDEHMETENNIQQELTAQNKLVKLYKEDRDHVKEKLVQVTTAINELKDILKQVSEDKTELEAKLKSESESNIAKLQELQSKIKEQAVELENANDLLQLSRKKGQTIVPEDQLSNLSPMAASTSAILKKGMTLTQIYTEYVKVSDELLGSEDENTRLKLYMEQILTEVEEKAPLLMQQKEDYEHARKTVGNMSTKLEQNIKELHRLQNEHSEYERKVDFHKREEKRLHTLCVDLSRQVRVLLKECEEARGGVVSSSDTLPDLLSSDDMNVSSSGQVISEHLVTFKTIEELQSQNQRLLATVRELSEEQEKLEQEGGAEIIQELKKRIENAKDDLNALKVNQKTQDEMMEQISRQRDMYKVLCQSGGVMVGDISSTSVLGPHSLIEAETELTKVKAELDNTIGEYMKFQEMSTTKERSLSDTISKQEEELSSIRLERDRMKNQLEFSEGKHSILSTTSDGYKKQISALEGKCRSLTEALNKCRVEVEKYKQDYSDTRERLVTSEVTIKASETEKHLIKEAEKRLMQENQSLLDQQRSQNVLLTNLQSIQNNLERQEFETRKTLGKQVDNLQREMKALRRHNEKEGDNLKTTATSLEKEVKELKIKLGVELESKKKSAEEIENLKQLADQFEAKCKEFEALHRASEDRLSSVLEREASGREKEDYQHEMERYKIKVRELELAVSNTVTDKKAIKDQLTVVKKHAEQYKEIADSNEEAISVVTKNKETIEEEHKKKLNEANDTIKSLKNRIGAVVAEKMNLKKSAEKTEKTFQYQISDLKGQMAPLERRFQEVTRALVHAKELETSALKESQAQAQVAKEAQDKYERELVLHAKDVEQLTLVKDELQVSTSRYGGLEDRVSEMKQTLESNDKLMQQMKDHHRQELRKGEVARKDLIDQNAILHGQVEKLSAQLATAKSLNRTDDDKETSADKTIEEVYELLRFVRREKEICETKAEASEMESMRYRQRAEHLQRDLDEAKAALELELQRTQGRMLTEEEHKDMMEKMKKAKEYGELNKNLEKQKADLLTKNKVLTEKNKKLEADIKPLKENKKLLEGEKSSWLAEKTALKGEIERWTNRTNQLMANSTKTDNEEIKKLQSLKTQNEKVISAMQDEVKRTKQQLDHLKRESLKLKNREQENQNKITSLQTDLTTAQNNVSKGPRNPADNEQLTAIQKEQEELKKTLQLMTADLNEKNKMVQQLKKLAKKYKTQSDRLQKLLRENNIDFAQVIATPITASESDTAVSNALTVADKKKLEAQVAEKDKAIEDISKQLADLVAQNESQKTVHSDLETKFKETQEHYINAEKKNKEMSKKLTDTEKQVADFMAKEEKNKKILKTAQNRIQNVAKTSRELENAKKQLLEAQSKMQQAAEQSGSYEASKTQLEAKVLNLEKYVKELLTEKKTLTAKIDELQNHIDKIQDEKKTAETFIKTAVSQQAARIQAMTPGANKAVTSSVELTAATEAPGNSPLTATVRPTSTPSCQSTLKFQLTPTASIRPHVHMHPTAMISPTVPVTQSTTTPVASVAAQPISAVVLPHVAEPQNRSATASRLSDRTGTSFKAPVARVAVQAQAREDDTSTSVTTTMEDDQQMESETGPSTRNKRSHVEIEEEQDDDVTYLLDDEEDHGSKRQRIEVALDVQEQQLDTDSQEVQLEEEELLAEEGDDDVLDASAQQYADGGDEVMDAPTQKYAETVSSQASSSGVRESQLHMQRQLQPSPHELLRQQRSSQRGRSQLPSFSLMSGQSGFYEETDDSTVPSTPTLYMPKRTDGFAEAVSSPLVRFPAFSFANNEHNTSSSTTPALEQSALHLDQTQVDLMGPEDPASVPLTPLSIVPSVSASELTAANSVIAQQSSLTQTKEGRHVTFGGQFFAEDNGQEQNVPQHIDLTEEEEEGEQAQQVTEALDESIDEVVEGEDEEGFVIFASTDDIGEEEQDAESESTSESSESEDSGEPEEEQVQQQDEGSDCVEAEEEVVNVGEVESEEDSEQQDDILDVEDSVPEEQEAPADLDTIIHIGETLEADESGDEPHDEAVELEQVTSSSSEVKEEQETSEVTKQEESDRPRPVRLQRSIRGIRPQIRRLIPGRLVKPEKSSDEK